MRLLKFWLLAILVSAACETATLAQTAPPASNAQATAPAAPPANAAPPPSAPAKRSQSDLEKLVAPIALYPDPLLATLLPASAYPLEIVQAARFVKDTNNIAKLDSQKWDDNVKAIARFPQVIAQMNDNIAWTSDMGDAFIDQPKEVMDAVQTMRRKAKESGALKTTPQQVVTETDLVVTNTVEQQTVYVTNEVIQVQPAQTQVVYVPQYNPTVVYAGYPVAYPGYYYPPPPYYGSVAAASVVSFGVGFTVGAIAANNCDWGHGGCWHGGDVNVNRNVNVNNTANINRTANANRSANANVNRGQKWQPDQNRLKNSGSTLSSSQSREARGYPSASSRSASGAARGSSGSTGLSPTGRSTDRASSAGANRSASSAGANRSASSAGANRSASSTGVSRSGSSSQRSAFSGGGTSQTRQASSRGSVSRGGGGGGRGRGQTLRSELLTTDKHQ